MNRKNIVNLLCMLLLSLLPIALAVGLESLEMKFRREVSDFRATELIFWAGRYTEDQGNSCYEERKINDPEVIDALWKMITEQQKQSEIKGGNYLGGTPYLILHAPNGAEYKLSYTWDREEWDHDEYGMPVVSTVGRAFVVTGTHSRKYSAVSQEAEKEFDRIIMDCFQTNAMAVGKNRIISQEKAERKSAKTDSIVFVDHYLNWAWGYQNNGYFLDCWGNVYTFDYSDREVMEEDEFKEALWETYCNTEPVEQEVCDSERLFDILINDVYEINRDAKRSYKPAACDAGQRTLYVCDCDFEMIELCSTGDVEKKLQDQTARRLCKYYDKTIRSLDIW